MDNENSFLNPIEPLLDESNNFMEENDSKSMIFSPKVENPWNIQSIYELQYFNCPNCIYKNQSKQDFINHAFENHPEVTGTFVHIYIQGAAEKLAPLCSTVCYSRVTISLADPVHSNKYIFGNQHIQQRQCL